MQIKTNNDEEFKTVAGPFDKVVPVDKKVTEEKEIPSTSAAVPVKE